MDIKNISLIELLNNHVNILIELKKRKLDQSIDFADFIDFGLKYYDYIEVYPEEVVRKKINNGKKFDHLKQDELLKIDLWKTRKGRNQHHIKNNKPEFIISQTRDAFHSNTEKEIIQKLKVIKGIGLPTASAVLMFHDPKRYGVFDVRVCRILFELGITEKKFDTKKINDFLEYNVTIRRIAEGAERKLNRKVTIRDIDKTLFILDLIFQGKIEN